MTVIINGTDNSASTPAVTGTDGDTGMFYPAANTVALSTGGSERMRVDSSGNVGIGTTAPDANARLTLRDAGGSGPVARVLFNSATAGVTNGTRVGFTAAGFQPDFEIWNGDSGIVRIATANTERMRIDSSGNVGVGTTAPSQRLDATVGSTTQGSGLAVTNTQAGGYGSGVTFYSYRGDGTTKLPAGGISMEGNASWADAANTSSNMRFYTVNANTYTERMRILAGGQVNIATTGDTAAFLVVNGGDTHCINTLRNGTGVSTHIAFRNGNGQVGTINTSVSSTSYNTSSDYRLKENIAPMTGALATVAQLNPVTYTWKTDGSAGQGFIAHELQAIVPDCVTGDKDAVETYTDAEGVEQTRPVYQGVDTSFLVATLTAAIQELSAKNEALEARIAALETK